MNRKIRYSQYFIVILTLFLSLFVFLQGKLQAKPAVPQAAATAIIDDQLQYEAYYSIKNSFFSITLDNQVLKTPGPKGLPIQASFLSPGSRPTWIHVAPNPILKIYYNTPDAQTLVYEVKLNQNASVSIENENRNNKENNKDNENIQSFPININLSQFHDATNSKKNHPKSLQLLLQIATTHSNDDMHPVRYFIMMNGKH